MKRWGFAAVVALAAAYYATFVSYGAFAEDEGLLLIQFARTLRGELPYTDFHTGYPPATFYWNATLFRLFGESVIPLRIVLVAVNATSVGLVFALAQPLAGTALAVVAALGWGAYLPFFPGHFASFNIPYPSWYATCAYLAAQLAVDRHLARGRRGALFAAGLAAGAAFAFKQNAGALAVLATGLVLAIGHAGDRDDDRIAARILLVLAAAFLMAGFTSASLALESVIVIGPTVLLLAGRLLWARGAVRGGIRLWPGLALVSAGIAAVTLPWLVIFLRRLGVSGLAHEIFLVGTDFDLVYGTPYPIPIGFPEIWPFVVTLGVAAIAFLGTAVDRGRLTLQRAGSLLAVATVGALALFVRVRQMPEGLARSIMLQVQHIGFYAAPMLATWVVLRLLRRLRVDVEPARRERRVMGALVFALCLFAELYPRVDTTHLIIAMPSAFVLAAWATARLATSWSRALALPRRVFVGAILALAAVIIGVATIPSFGSIFDARLRRRPQATVDSPRLPVHVERDRDEDVRALNALLAWLRTALAPGEKTFAFPAVALVPYALGVGTVTPHDYFFAGRPDHLEEAVIVRTLRERAPRYVVTLNRRFYFFMNAPAYYFILRDWVKRHYRLAARFGRYDVLRRDDVPGEAEIHDDFGPTVAWDGILATLAGPDAEARRAAIARLLDESGGGDALVARIATLAPDVPSQLLVVRGLGEYGDARAGRYLVDAYEHGPWRLKNDAAGSLLYIVVRHLERGFPLATTTPAPDPELGAFAASLDPERLRTWLHEDSDRARIGVFAAWAAGERGDVALVPELRRAIFLEPKKLYFRVIATVALFRLGETERLCDVVEILGRHKHDVQDSIPNILLELGRTHADLVAGCLEQGLADRERLAREVVAWTSGAAGLPAVAPALRRALDDPERRVRIAAVWALGALRDAPARAAIERLSADADVEIASFAREALQRLDGAPW